MATITSPRAPSPNPSRITSPSLPSRAGTPTSSVRPSFDLPRASFSTTLGSPSLTAPNSTNPTSQRRNRAALRDYYNLKQRNQAGGGASSLADLHRTASVRSDNSDSTLASSAVTAPYDENNNNGMRPSANGRGGGSSVLPPQIDDPTFDADAYISDLLRTSTLRDILRIESTLVSEIRNLDGERKALVYDNYSKLIKAVGTIGEMQKGMKDQSEAGTGIGAGIGIGIGIGLGAAIGHNRGQMIGLSGVRALEDKLERLLDLVQQLKEERTNEATVARARQARILRGERKKQDLVRWVLDAPARLTSLVEKDERSEAEKQYEIVRGLLDGWKGVQGVEEIRESCQKILATPTEESDSDDIGSTTANDAA